MPVRPAPVAVRLCLVSLVATAGVLVLPATGSTVDERTPTAAARPTEPPARDLERASRSARRTALQPPAPAAPAVPVAAVAPPAYVLPVEGPLTSPFGRRWGRLHAGLDIGVPVGTPVRALTRATVLGVTVAQGGYGTSLQLALPDGTVVVLGHLSQVLVPAGPVEAGQVVALSGDSGRSTGPHLHLELRGPQGPFDPRPWLAARGLVL